MRRLPLLEEQLDRLRVAAERQAEELSGLLLSGTGQQQQQQLVAFQGRLAALERLLGVSEDRHTHELKALGDAREQLRVAEEQLAAFTGRLAHEVADLQAAHARQEAELTKQAREEKVRAVIQCSLADRLGSLEKSMDDKFDRLDGRISVVRGIWARDREHLLGAYQQLDEMSDSLQKEVAVKEELSAELREVYGGARRAVSPCPSSSSPESDALAAVLQHNPTSIRTPPRAASVACDWDKAVKRMQSEGMVHVDTAKGEPAVPNIGSTLWRHQRPS